MAALIHMSEVFHYTFIWHISPGPNPCRKCACLNGREYHDQDLFADFLMDPQFGPVWDLNMDQSLMHGARGTCRCFLEAFVEADLMDAEAVKEFALALREGR